jgi:hypothetical protein
MVSETARRVLADKVRRIDAEQNEEEAARGRKDWDKAQFGWDFRERFCGNFRVTQKAIHPGRRPEEKPEVTQAFFRSLGGVFRDCDPRHVLNVDETFWRVSNATRLTTLAYIGAEDVTVDTGCDDKEGLTAICAVSAAGVKLPVWVICKGKSDKCQRRFENYPQLAPVIDRQLFLVYSPSGWVDKEICKDYLEWAREWLMEHEKLDPDYTMAVVWDCYSAHRKDEVKERATKLGIELAYIPAGQTAKYQPLDRRIFGILKKKAVAEWMKVKLDEAMTEEKLAINIVWAIHCLVQQWDKITEDQIMGAWDIYV